MYLSSFLKDQYYLRQDYALDAFIKIVRHYSNDAQKHEKEKRNQVEPEVLDATGRLVDYTKTAEEIINVIYSINQDTTLTKHEASERTVQLIENYLEAKDPNVITSFNKISELNSDKKRRRYYYERLEASSRIIQLKLSPFIKTLEFDVSNSSPKFIDAINYFKRTGGKISNDAPTAFLTKKENEIILDNENNIRPSLYKILLFISLADAIKSRKLTLLYSYRYKANNRYLIPDHEWQSKKDSYITAAGLDKFKDVNSILQGLQEKLEDTYSRVNTNVINGDNPHLKYTHKLRWDVKTPKTDYDVSKYIPTLLGNTKFIPLSQIISEINRHTNFSEHFTHSHIKNSKSKVSNKIIYALLMSLGCNLGHRKLAASSVGNISEDQLINAENWLFSKENIQKANNVIVLDGVMGIYPQMPRFTPFRLITIAFTRRTYSTYCKITWQRFYNQYPAY